MIKRLGMNMNLLGLHCAVSGLILLFLFASGCNPAPIGMPHTATPSAASLEDNPTTGAIARSTRQVQATATQRAVLDEAAMQAAVQATQAAVKSTQTAETQVAATATVIARATTQAIMTEKAAWPLQIKESFTDNQLGWPIGLKQDHSLAVTSTIEGGGYQWVVKVNNGNSYFNLVPTTTVVITDFAAAVNVKFEPVDDEAFVTYGLTFRQFEDDYGFFGITPSGMWQALEVHHTGIYQQVLSSSDLIDTRPGHTNRLEVIARGSDFVFLINGKQVGMLSAEIDAGQIGLGVDAIQSAAATQVAFTDFEVHAPQNQGR
jgi:hypothetical protein